MRRRSRSFSTYIQEDLVFNGKKNTVDFSNKDNWEKAKDTLIRRDHVKLPEKIWKMIEEYQATTYQNKHGEYITNLYGKMPNEFASTNFKDLNKNPFFNIDLAIDEKLAGGKEQLEINKKKLEDGKARGKRIFEETRADTLKYIDKLIQKYPENENKFNLMKERVRTISFNNVVDNKKYKEMYHCKIPNMFYSSSKHSVTICPVMFEYSESALKANIAHEIGHSIDPCVLSFDLIKSESTKCKYQYAVTLFDIIQTDLKDRCKEQKFSPASLAIPYKDNPMKNILMCLQGKKSIAARVNNKEEFEKDLDETIKVFQDLNAKESGDNLGRLQKVKSDFNDFFETHEGCSFNKDKQIGEAWADWIGTEVFASSINQSLDSKQDVLESAIGSFALNSCIRDINQIKIRSNKFLEDLGCQIVKKIWIKIVITIYYQTQLQIIFAKKIHIQ